MLEQFKVPDDLAVRVMPDVIRTSTEEVFEGDG